MTVSSQDLTNNRTNSLTASKVGGSVRTNMALRAKLWGISSVGRASGWQPEGHGFESLILHLKAQFLLGFLSFTPFELPVGLCTVCPEFTEVPCILLSLPCILPCTKE
jgi:hypothetical protein